MIVEPVPIHGLGTFATFQDPDGVMIGLFEEKVPGSASMTRAMRCDGAAGEGAVPLTPPRLPRGRRVRDTSHPNEMS
jgi:hypothetical protein